MKVLLISNSDIYGGAARATHRLHQGLHNIGVSSQMLVQDKYTEDNTIHGSPVMSGIGRAINGTRLFLDKLPLKPYLKGNNTNYSLNWLPETVNSKVRQISPNLINLHWIGAGCLQIETIAKFKQPIIWTLHDMWAFTGGCHYDLDCDRYIDSCGVCPQLNSSKDSDLSRWVWKRKHKSWKNINFTVITPSSWLQKSANSSSLFRDRQIEVIPNGIDTKTYRSINKKIARNLLELPQDKQLVLFGALGATSDNRKGFHLLQPALQALNQSKWQDKLELVVFGASKPDNPADFGFPVHYLGTLSDDLCLSLIYSAADVFVLSSIQDNLPNTAMESLACGTPCVAFKIGGMPDLIEHQQNGYLANPFEIDDLARGIAWVLENEARHQKLSARSRDKVEQEFTLEIQATRYRSLFTEILTQNASFQSNNFALLS